MKGVLDSNSGNIQDNASRTGASWRAKGSSTAVQTHRVELALKQDKRNKGLHPIERIVGPIKETLSVAKGNVCSSTRTCRKYKLC